MRKVTSLVLLAIGVSALASAAAVVSAPEIDAGAAVNAVALLAGALLVVRGRRKN